MVKPAVSTSSFPPDKLRGLGRTLYPEFPVSRLHALSGSPSFRTRRRFESNSAPVCASRRALVPTPYVICSAYREAVQVVADEAAGREVPRWLDIGTGSGLLASFVASAYARSRPVEVYACEVVDEVARVAAHTFARGRRSRDVRLFRRHSTELRVGDGGMPSRATHVISEVMGSGQSVTWPGRDARP